jgi:hypothetical protein
MITGLGSSSTTACLLNGFWDKGERDRHQARKREIKVGRY